MKYNTGDIIDTTLGLLTIICPLKFNENETVKYKVVSNKTLYWMQDLDKNDVFKWDTELEEILTDEEKMILDLPEEEFEL